jgi:hypothetical protein
MTATQAKVLIEQIKYNAKQFIRGQERSAGKGGGGGAPGGKDDKGGKDDGKSKESKDDKGGKDDSGGDGKDSKGSPSGLQGVIQGVSGLIKRFGEQMKDKDRARLEDAVGKLKELR